METIKGENPERAAYREKCKHYGMEGMCYYYSGSYGWAHISYGCTATQKCPRMKRYDKLHQND